jgi:hypothetical protein
VFLVSLLYRQFVAPLHSDSSPRFHGSSAPLQLWEAALAKGRVSDFDSYDGRLGLLRDARQLGVKPVSIFGHGAGGSGKTYCVSSVIAPVYEHYLPGHSRRQASQNSAARLMRGQTMHAMAGLVKDAPYTHDEPSQKVRKKLAGVWEPAGFVWNDEVGASAPALYGTLDSRAFWGRADQYGLDPKAMAEHPFGDPFLLLDTGDFGQLRPVPRGSTSLMEAFLLQLPEYSEEKGPSSCPKWTAEAYAASGELAKTQ